VDVSGRRRGQRSGEETGGPETGQATSQGGEQCHGETSRKRLHSPFWLDRSKSSPAEQPAREVPSATVRGVPPRSGRGRSVPAAAEQAGTHQEVEQRQESRDRRSHVGEGGDRKSTRLNSSHVKISYAVVC